MAGSCICVENTEYYITTFNFHLTKTMSVSRRVRVRPSRRANRRGLSGIQHASVTGEGEGGKGQWGGDERPAAAEHDEINDAWHQQTMTHTKRSISCSSIAGGSSEWAALHRGIRTHCGSHRLVRTIAPDSTPRPQSFNRWSYTIHHSLYSVWTSNSRSLIYKKPSCR